VKTVLIIEDDRLSMVLFKDLLQAHGCHTIQSIDGLNTVQLTKEHHPDLILLDIKLPEISGLEHIKSLKADNDLKHIPVIAVTAFAMKGDKEKIFQAGFDGYISKPVTVSYFLREVKRFLTLKPFRLTEALITGHSKIDAEHEQLTELLNDFIILLDADDDKQCAKKIEEITETVKIHFESEERIMEKFEYMNLEPHKKEHQRSLEKYEALVKESEQTGYGDNFTNELTAVLVNDMIRTDADFKAHFQDRKVKN